MSTFQSEAATAPEAAVEAAAGRLVGILNDSSAAILASIGYQTGLFEAMADLPAATSEQVADAAGLNERYVREWLGGMTTAGFVDYNPAARTYLLRPDVAPSVTGPGVDNLARTLMYITLMGEVAGKIAGKFRTGGGLNYADYPGFVEIQAADSGSVHDASLIDAIVPLAGRVDALRTGIDVADIGCGAGHAVNLMAAAFPASRFTGYDFLEEALAAGRVEAERLGLTNVRFEQRDAAGLDIDEELDLVTVFDAIHDQAHPATVLRNIHRALRPGGTFLMVDMKASSKLEENLDLPWATFLYAISTTHCMSVSLAQGGDALGTVWGVQRAGSMVREAGFDEVDVKELDDDPFNAYFVARKPELPRLR
ncbi:ubiquinone/menaquinone biosynthesis C-methylase UbiE [Arthrobacter globiformis]|uniref:class I SAM-dependent methyltransferase n=1 Tax=Arthrobacter globiformis TaxID=1665 RepID=UPI00278556FD|nr:class I SAM-dependent methyltransferase [Arthrobacter globiformis]MDQ1058688.1 ubiquinone/menaquinone biosynthesis C-methylase UbiE [Arthrobacter globiformis]